MPTVTNIRDGGEWSGVCQRDRDSRNVSWQELERFFAEFFVLERVGGDYTRPGPVSFEPKVASMCEICENRLLGQTRSLLHEIVDSKSMKTHSSHRGLLRTQNGRGGNGGSI